MLILTRYPGQEIYIGEDIKIRVLSVNRWNQVRIGIEAPEDIDIWRGELVEDYGDFPERKK